MSCGCTGMGRYARRDGVFGIMPVGQCDVLSQRAIYHPAEIWQDGSYFSTQFTARGADAYKFGGNNSLYQFRICVYNAIVAAMASQCGGQYAPQICLDYQAADRVVLGNRLAILAERSKGIAANQTTLSTTPKLISNLSSANVVSSTVRVGVGTKPIPQSVVPLPKGTTATPTASNGVNLVEKDFQGIRYVAASDVDSAGILATLAIPQGRIVAGTKDFSGAHWTIISNDPASMSPEPAALLSGIVGNGDAIIMSADADSVYITGTKYIDQAAALCPVGQSEIFVLSDPPAGWQLDWASGTTPAPTSDGTPPSNTMLYVGVGVGIVAVGGLIAYLATRKN